MFLIGNAINPDYKPLAAYQAWVNKARDEHLEGAYNAAISSVRHARDIAIYEICGTINHPMVRDCTTMINIYYSMMRENNLN
ncbi:hypothetical protein [Rhizobium phage RHEph16]|uniref:Uncharacterized protein n=1 Tax=Rhizobium phage RHEph16 TaxID=2836132 RepID=A0AAE7VM48_9CAUD|nr:hypothetical protein PP750_gp02 [Rhizobium phage RHEph16]QXV74311.1 hypothetical protein [Rhizobium phage RHEph16]